MRIKVAVGSALVTTAVAPLVRRLMIRTGTLDVPNHRSSHSEPTPRGGGIAILAGMAAVAPHAGIRPTTALAIQTLAAAGFVDDRRSARGGLSASIRLAAQGVSALTLATRHSPAAVGVAIIAVPGMVNVFNFMDGINGISAMTAIVWGVNAATSAVPEVSWLGSALFGSALGFLPWNAPTAQLFLGDVGSYLIGGVLASGAVRTLVGGGTVRDAVIVSAPLILYAADAGQAIFAGARNGLPLTDAHRRHVYQQLVDNTGLTHMQVATLHAGGAAAMTLAVRRGGVAGILTSGCVSICYLVTPRLVGRRLASRRGVAQ